MILAMDLAVVTTYLLGERSMAATKTCFKCDVEQPITEFYRHPRMGDGRLGKCKKCTRRDVQENYNGKIEYYRAYDRRRGRRPGPKHKEAARNAVNAAIVSGRLVRGNCEVGVDCRGRIEAHHDDYKKHLEVRWLCKKHHAEIHTMRETA